MPTNVYNVAAFVAGSPTSSANFICGEIAYILLGGESVSFPFLSVVILFLPFYVVNLFEPNQ